MRQSCVKCGARPVEETKGGIVCPADEMLIAGAARGVVEGSCGKRLWEWEVHGERGEGLVVAAADMLRGMRLLRCSQVSRAF